jgi:hypothetical protein
MSNLFALTRRFLLDVPSPGGSRRAMRSGCLSRFAISLRNGLGVLLMSEQARDQSMHLVATGGPERQPGSKPRRKWLKVALSTPDVPSIARSEPTAPVLKPEQDTRQTRDRLTAATRLIELMDDPSLTSTLDPRDVPIVLAEVTAKQATLSTIQRFSRVACYYHLIRRQRLESPIDC